MTSEPLPSDLPSPESIAFPLVEKWMVTYLNTDKIGTNLVVAIAQAIASDRLRRVGLDVEGAAQELVRRTGNLTQDAARSILLSHLRPDPLVEAVVGLRDAWRTEAGQEVVGSDDIDRYMNNAEKETLAYCWRKLDDILPACRALAHGRQPT